MWCIDREGIIGQRAPSPGTGGIGQAHVLNGRLRDGIDLRKGRTTRGDATELAVPAIAAVMIDVEIGDVGGAVDERVVIITVGVMAVIIGVAEISARDEVVTACADAVVGIAIAADVEPDGDTKAVADVIDTDEAVGRKRGPSAIAVAVTPADPGGCPSVTGDPAPASSIEINPATVMVGGPPPRFVRSPSPARVGIDPMACGVGGPFGVIDVGLPDITVVGALDPSSLLGEVIVESLEGGGLIGSALVRSTLIGGILWTGGTLVWSVLLVGRRRGAVGTVAGRGPLIGIGHVILRAQRQREKCAKGQEHGEHCRSFHLTNWTLVGMKSFKELRETTW